MIVFFFFFGAVSYPHDQLSLSRDEFLELVLVARRSLASYVRDILPIERNSIYEIILVKVNWCDLSIFLMILLRICLSLIFEFKNQKNGLKVSRTVPGRNIHCMKTREKVPA